MAEAPWPTARYQNTFSLRASDNEKSVASIGIEVSAVLLTRARLLFPSGTSPISSGVFLIIFVIGINKRGKNRVSPKAVAYQPTFSEEMSMARKGTMAKVPTENPTDPMDMARLLFLENQLLMMTVIGIQPPNVTPNIMVI